MTPDSTPSTLHPVDPDTETIQELFDPDDEFAQPTGHRLSRRVAAALTTALVAALAYTGGVLVQKNHDAHTTSSAMPSLSAGGLPGFASGTFVGGQASSGSTATTGTSGPAIIGTVVSVHGTDVTVKDIGGKTHLVRTSTTTTVVHQSAAAVSSLTPGTTVTVDGATAGDGTVTATTLTTR